MIADTFERGAAYSLGDAWNAVFPEVARLVRSGMDLKAGKMSIAGAPAGVYANVEEYAPKKEAEARFESHVRMADIQIVLEGEEFIDVFPLDGSEAVVSSDTERDLTFYAEKRPAVRVRLQPGLFALVMPGEAHKPCIEAGAARVRKMVVKIPAELLGAPSAPAAL